MESLIIHLIDDTIHPRTVVFLPILMLLQIVHECHMSLIEISIAATHLRLVDTLGHSLLLFGGLLFFLIRWMLLSAEGYAYHQHNRSEQNLSTIKNQIPYIIHQVVCLL